MIHDKSNHTPIDAAVGFLAALCVGALCLVGVPAPAAAEPPPPALDLSGFRVTDRDAAFIDVPGRIATLRTTGDPDLIGLRDRNKAGVACREFQDLVLVERVGAIPSFTLARRQWEVAVVPLIAFETAVGRLTSAWIASGDPYHADCLAALLARAAERNAFADFEEAPAYRQARFSLEQPIIAASLGYSVIRGHLGSAPGRRRVIEDWLKRIAAGHFARSGKPDGCCRDHYYRRALYLTAVGIVTGDDQMFRTGVSAPLAALQEMNAEGALGPAILAQGREVLHNQAQALQYLTLVMTLAERQGYPLFERSLNGRTLRQAVAFLVTRLQQSQPLAGFTAEPQDLGFVDDPQYFVWAEIWLARTPDRTLRRFVECRRPIFHRGLGGDATLLFKRPESADAVFQRQLEQKRAGAGPRFPPGSVAVDPIGPAALAAVGAAAGNGCRGDRS